MTLCVSDTSYWLWMRQLAEQVTGGWRQRDPKRQGTAKDGGDRFTAVVVLEIESGDHIIKNNVKVNRCDYQVR